MLEGDDVSVPCSEAPGEGSASVTHLGLALGVALLLVLDVILDTHRGHLPLHWTPRTGAAGVALVAAAGFWLRCARDAFRRSRPREADARPAWEVARREPPVPPLPAATHIDGVLWRAIRASALDELASRARATPRGTERDPESCGARHADASTCPGTPRLPSRPRAGTGESAPFLLNAGRHAHR